MADFVSAIETGVAPLIGLRGVTNRTRTYDPDVGSRSPLPLAELNWTKTSLEIMHNMQQVGGSKWMAFERKLRTHVAGWIAANVRMRIQRTLADSQRSARSMLGKPLLPIQPSTRGLRMKSPKAGPLRDTGKMMKGGVVTKVDPSSGRVTVTLRGERARVLQLLETGFSFKITPQFRKLAKLRAAEFGRQAGNARISGAVGGFLAHKEGRAASWFAMSQIRLGKTLHVPARPVVQPAFEMAIKALKAGAAPEILSAIEMAWFGGEKKMPSAVYIGKGASRSTRYTPGELALAGMGKSAVREASKYAAQLWLKVDAEKRQANAAL